MIKPLMKDMSYKDRNDYRYYKRFLADMKTYGSKWAMDMAEKRIEQLNDKYCKKDVKEWLDEF